MKHIATIVFWTTTLGFGQVGLLSAGESKSADAPVDAEEENEPAEAPSSFSRDQLRRLNELRDWLNRRKLERGEGLEGVIEARRKQFGGAGSESSGRQLLTSLGQRFTPDLPNRNKATLHIGRGPDGRIRHRYVFGDLQRKGGAADTDSGESTASPQSSAEWGHKPVRQRIVRIWVPETSESAVPLDSASPN